MGSVASYYMFFGFEITKKEWDIIDSYSGDYKIFNHIDFMDVGYLDEKLKRTKICLYFTDYEYTAEFDDIVPVLTTIPSRKSIDIVKEFFNEVEIAWKEPKWYLSGMVW